MNTHRTTTYAAAALLALTVLTGCSSNSATGPTTTTSNSADPAPTPLALDRKNVAAVAAAFAADYAGGNTPAACALSTPALVAKLTQQGLCSSAMSWNEVPTQIESCPIVNGKAHFVYQVPREIERFLLFGINLTNTAGVWSVSQLGGHTPGDNTYGCSLTSPGGGG